MTLSVGSTVISGRLVVDLPVHQDNRGRARGLLVLDKITATGFSVADQSAALAAYLSRLPR